MNGYERFTAAARSFAAIVAISSRISESFQVELMEDNRVGLLYPDLLQTISEELKWVISLPDHIWRSLAEFAGRDPMAVRDEIIHAAHMSYRFLWRRVVASLLCGGGAASG